jgi:hypothetical protein
VKHLLQSTYVDDIVTGADSDEVTFELYTQSKMIFRLGGFNLRKFLSNSRVLQLDRPIHSTRVLSAKFKILFQKLCHTKLDWDGELSGDLKESLSLGAITTKLKRPHPCIPSVDSVMPLHEHMQP